MPFALNRRHVVAALLSTLVPHRVFAAPPPLGPGTPFSFQALADAARRDAAEPFRPVVIPSPDVLERLDYDAVWRISFRPDASHEVGGFPLQMFHLGRYAREPVRIHLLQDGLSHELRYADTLFTMPEDSPAHELKEGDGFAGFRLMRPGSDPDWISFLGASYFRTDGPERQYGLSARGLAINTGLSEPEEFPRFSSFWIGDAEREGEDVVVYARLDSPSVTGAYRFGIVRGDAFPTTKIDARIFFRSGVQRLGVAPLTSMYWYSQLNRPQATDWRPEIHDTDGLALHMSTGERLWRSLRNPRRVTTASYFDASVRGFGLVQRDRDFQNYQDDGVFYDRRPSGWVVPAGDWGPGAVQLVEIPTDDETFDNIVAYWTPQSQPAAGAALAYEYALEWRPEDPEPPTVARTWATWRGHGGVPGQSRPANTWKYVIDFDGGPLPEITDGVELIVDAAAPGTISLSSVRPVVGTPRWRAIFDVTAPPATPVELRAYLHRGGEPLTETWTFLHEL